MLNLDSDGLDRSALWQKMFKAFNYGDVLITLGTGELTASEERGLGLAGQHDYAVIEMREHRGQRLLLIKNPWSEATTWRGHIRCADSLVRDIAGLNSDPDGASNHGKRPCLNPGTFWMALDHIFHSFESIYLNWNPGLFSWREDVHFVWDLTISSSPDGCFRSNPQYSVNSNRGGILWVLLGKHFKSPCKTSTSPKQHINSLYNSDDGFISLYAFDNGGHRVSSTDEALATSQYVDSPNTLLKLEVPPHTTYTVAISQQALPKARHTLTLSTLSLTPVTLAPAIDRYAHATILQGKWTASSAGGNTFSSSYHVNPQFRIKLTEMSDVSLMLQTSSASFSVNVKLLWASGRNVRSVTTCDIIGDSGEYTKSFALLETMNVPVGNYTIICSTFETGQIGEFSLHVSSTSRCDLFRLPISGAGRFMCEANMVTFQQGTDRLTTSLWTSRINRISLSARSASIRSSSDRSSIMPLKVSLELGRGSSMRLIATSGNDDFRDTNPNGAYIQDVSIDPTMCGSVGLWIAIERLASSSLDEEEVVDIDISSDEPIKLGFWTARP